MLLLLLLIVVEQPVKKLVYIRITLDTLVTGIQDDVVEPGTVVLH